MPKTAVNPHRKTEICRYKSALLYGVVFGFMQVGFEDTWRCGMDCAVVSMFLVRRQKMDSNRIVIKNQGRTMMLGQDVFWYVKARNSLRYLTITDAKIHVFFKFQVVY